MSAGALAGPAKTRERLESGILAWIAATNHKKIGILYLMTTFAWFGVAGVLAMLIRVELLHPGAPPFNAHVYNQMFTEHGTSMIFLVVAPIGFGLANFLIPLQIGAADMAFPRLNAFSYWLFLFGSITVWSGSATDGGAGAAGWTAYAPLSEIKIAYGAGQDLWILGLLIVGVSTILTAVNFMTTILVYRAPGMTMWRMPIFVWEMLGTSLLILMAFPSLTAVLAMLLIDRRLGGHFFDAAMGGNAILYQHLFWFFGHPEVYVLILPFFGVITEVVATFSRKPVFGYVGLVLATFAIAGLSMTVWAHHMFTTGAVVDPFFSGLSFLIAVPTGIKFFDWIGTMWRGHIRLATPMLFALGFLFNFLIGGVTGVMVASPPIDFQARDTYFLVAHFHYTIGGGSLFAIFAAVYFWFPKMFGYLLDERLGKWNFWFMFVGFNVTFGPQFILGTLGMMRRYFTYPDIPSWVALNDLSSFGALLQAVGVLLFLANLIVSARKRVPAGDDPWGGYTLEWATSSPPPELNFDRLPPIRSARPTFDMRQAERAARADAAS